MRNHLVRVLQAIAVFMAVLPLAGCGSEELSERRTRLVRQSPFLFMAPGATQLVSIDINRFRQLSLYEDLREVFLRDEGRLSAWNELSRRQDGKDPLSQIDLVVFAGHAPSFKRPMNEVVLIITGNWGDHEAFLESIRLLSAEGFLENPPEFQPYAETNVYNAYTLSAESSLHPGERVTLYVSFPGQGICVFSLSEERFDNCNAAIFGTGKSIDDDTGWDHHFSRIRLDQPIWAAGWAPNYEWREFIEEKIQTVPELEGLWDLMHNHPATFYAYLGTENRYLLDVEMVCENEEAASLFDYDLNKARRVIPRMLNHWFDGDVRKISAWEALFEEIEVTREGASLFMRTEKTEEEVSELVSITAAEAQVTPTPKPVPDPFRRRD